MSKLSTLPSLTDSGRTNSPLTFRQELPYRAVAFLSGAILGLSAPGFDQWYLAWFGLMPILYLAFTARDPWYAGVRGWFFAMAYFMVYQNFYLFFRPEFGMGPFAQCPAFVSFFFWTTMSAWQGLFFSIFICVLRAVPMRNGWLPSCHQGRWYFPAFIVVPFLYVLIDKMCNSPLLFGVPWASLEYSQYKQTALIQIASVIGGVGLGAVIVLANVVLLGLLSFRIRALKEFSYNSIASMLLNTTVALSLIFALPVFGIWRLETQKNSTAKKYTVSAVQGCLSTVIHKVDSVKILDKHIELTEACPKDSLCVWPEWSLISNFTKNREVIDMVSKFPPRRNQTWVVGLLDTDEKGCEYNSVCAFDRTGTICQPIYHKRYLVPFGEFTPDWVRETPIGVLMYGPNHKYTDTTPDSKVVVFDCSDLKIGSMLCFECVLPKLSTDSVNSGAQLLVDCSNMGWFYPSILMDQMHAFCTMRAVENHRAFVFSTLLGPSAIFDSVGRKMCDAPVEQPAHISAEVTLETDKTPFTRLSF